MPVDGHCAWISDKGQNDEPWQGESFGVAKLGKADGHPFVTLVRLVFVCSEKQVPPGKIEAVVGNFSKSAGRHKKERDRRKTLCYAQGV